MKYNIANLHDSDFESLVCMLCQKLLGEATTPFAEGRDGGKDARFQGTALNYNGWEGKFIIQAKHTKDVTKSCSDNDFFANKSSVINDEISKIKKMQAEKQIDNYLLFTNRKLTGGADTDIRKHIENETGLKNVSIHGIEYIESLLQKVEYKEIVNIFKLNSFFTHIDFYEKDIKEVIIAFHHTIAIPSESPLMLHRPNIENKNKINLLDEIYYKNVILPDLDKFHDKITRFLEDPINEEYQSYYVETANELKRVIETYREDLVDFKKIFDFLTKKMIEKEPEKLQKYRNIIPAFFHFMYYQCDIGRNQ